jgi:hypothetical protein
MSRCRPKRKRALPLNAAHVQPSAKKEAETLIEAARMTSESAEFEGRGALGDLKKSAVRAKMKIAVAHRMPSIS